MGKKRSKKPCKNDDHLPHTQPSTSTPKRKAGNPDTLYRTPAPAPTGTARLHPHRPPCAASLSPLLEAPPPRALFEAPSPHNSPALARTSRFINGIASSIPHQIHQEIHTNPIPHAFHSIPFQSHSISSQDAQDLVAVGAGLQRHRCLVGLLSLVGDHCPLTPTSSHGCHLTKLSIINAGNVSMSIAQIIITQNLTDEIALVDVLPDKLCSKTLTCSTSLPRVCLVSDMDIVVTKGSDLAILTPGARQISGEMRLNLLQRNMALFRKIVPALVAHSPEASAGVGAVADGCGEGLRVGLAIGEITAHQG